MSGLRYFGGAVAFGFAAIWILASLRAAIVCVLSAAIGYCLMVVAERTRAKFGKGVSGPRISISPAGSPPGQAPEAGDLPLWADALNSDLGHVYQPAATTSALARDAEYGWPAIDDTAALPETLQ